MADRPEAGLRVHPGRAAAGVVRASSLHETVVPLDLLLVQVREGAGHVIRARQMGHVGIARVAARAHPSRHQQLPPHLGRQQVGASGNDETSLVMSAPNRPGAVHALLEPLARHGVSMTRIESRPARTGRWEYLFFIDLTGHRDDAPVAAALAELRRRAPYLKLLGSYPAAREP